MTFSFRRWLLLAGLGALIACDSDGGGAADSSTAAPDSAVLSDAGSQGSDTGAPSDGAVAEPTLEVMTRGGRVAGKLSLGVRAFLGIPFGAPPVGERRLKAPEPAQPWAGTRETKEFAPNCSQNVPSGTAFDPTSSEDCLYLNVWAPATASATPLPVMVWIYGGAYVFGGAGAPYNGETLVSRGNVIVVTLGYRLGPLGYIAHPALTAEAAQSGGAATNFGMLDQRLAFEWVRDNIAAFGGDPANVTIFGESAGGNSVTMHLISEGSWGLFHRAIIESGLVTKKGLTMEQAELAGTRYAERLGCAGADALACLRRLSPMEILSKSGNSYAGPGGLFYQRTGESNVFQPTIDGRVLKEQPLAAFTAGRVARVPVLHGVTRDEGVLFNIGVFGDRAPASLDEYRAALSNRFGAGTDGVIALYPDFATGLISVTNEAFFRCPTGRLARTLAAAGIPNYVYRFSLPLATALPALQGKAFHSADIPYVFGNSYLLGSVPAEHRGASELIMDYWTRFARSGDPNGAGAPTWPRYALDSTTHLELAPVFAAANDLASGCEFWDALSISSP